MEYLTAGDLLMDTDVLTVKTNKTEEETE